MLRRTGFKRPTYERPPAPAARPLERAPNYGGETSGPVPKEAVAAKPGKRQPNKQEREWMDAIVRYGCVACRIDGHGYMPAEVHHILRGGVRLGHKFTLPLCSGHHRDGAGVPGLVARHPWRVEFEARYGTEMELLERLQREIGADR